MLRIIKRFSWMILLVAGLQSSWGFALLGPLANGGDAWQTTVIGYGSAYKSFGLPGGPVYLGDIGGPKNIGEEYRRNVPVIVYSYNANWLDFFGSNGMAAVDSAVAIMNNLTNADSLDLSQYPLESQHFNPTAQAVYLTDLKSMTLHLLVEQMGLTQPERFTWTLHDRVVGPKCPITTTYTVVQRNYDTANPSLNSILYSPYVNNTLYTYSIEELCPGAYTINSHVDLLADQYNAVASNNNDDFGGMQVGGFYTGLTRDDVMGLRYLLTTNNINMEIAPAGSLQFLVVTNFAGPQTPFPLNPNSPTGFGTFDFGALILSATTNPPAVLQTNYPGLAIASSQNYYVLGTNATVTTTFGPAQIGSPYGVAPVPVLTTNYSYFPLQMYVTTYANVVTNYYTTNTQAILQTIGYGPKIGQPYPPPIVNITNNTYVTLTNVPSGSFYILPTFGPNECPVDILYTLQTNVVWTTNVITAGSTNTTITTGTNGTGTNTTFSYSQSLITWFTNYTYVTVPVTCTYGTNTPALYEGIGQVKFVRADYDSLLGQTFTPITNSYTMTSVVNSQIQVQHFDRVVNAPEILLTATDQGLPNTFVGTVFRSIQFDQTQVLPGLAGPGVITPASSFDYDKIGATFWNGPFPDTNSFLFPSTVNETTQTPSLAWASFDGSTNDPVVYPNGVSLANLVNQILIPISLTYANGSAVTNTLRGTNGVAFNPVRFTASTSRLTPPLTWTAAGLPPGLNVSAAGLLSGTPIQQAPSILTYDFTLILTDSLANSVQWTFPIIIQ